MYPIKNPRGQDGGSKEVARGSVSLERLENATNLAAGQYIYGSVDPLDLAADALNDMPIESETPVPAGPNTAGQGEVVSKFRFEDLAHVHGVGIAWIVKGLIIEGGVGQIYGDSRSGKTFLSVDLGMHIANGWAWYGFKTAQRPVRYLCLEGFQGFRRRLEAYKINSTKHLNGDFQFYCGDFSLMNEAEIHDLVSQLPQGCVLFIDTQAQATAGIDENSSALGVAIAHAQYIAKTANCTVILVHHTGKDASRGGRGWSGQLCAWDFELAVTRDGNSRKWKATKVKDGEDGLTFGFQLDLIDLGADEDGDRITSCVAVPSNEEEATKQKALTPSLQYGVDSLREALAGNECVHIEEWRKIFYRGHTGENIHAKQVAFHRARQTLVEKGIISVQNDNYSLTVTPSQTVTNHHNVTPHTITTVTHPFRGVTCDDVMGVICDDKSCDGSATSQGEIAW